MIKRRWEGRAGAACVPRRSRAGPAQASMQFPGNRCWRKVSWNDKRHKNDNYLWDGPGSKHLQRSTWPIGQAGPALGSENQGSQTMCSTSRLGKAKPSDQDSVQLVQNRAVRNSTPTLSRWARMGSKWPDWAWFARPEGPRSAFEWEQIEIEMLNEVGLGRTMSRPKRESDPTLLPAPSKKYALCRLQGYS